MGGEPYDPAITDQHVAQAKAGVKLAEMDPNQREAVAEWLDRTAGREFWAAQADPERGPQHLDVARQMREKAAEIRADELAPRRAARAGA